MRGWMNSGGESLLTTGVSFASLFTRIDITRAAEGDSDSDSSEIIDQTLTESMCFSYLLLIDFKLNSMRSERRENWNLFVQKMTKFESATKLMIIFCKVSLTLGKSSGNVMNMGFPSSVWFLISIFFSPLILLGPFCKQFLKICSSGEGILNIIFHGLLYLVEISPHQSEQGLVGEREIAAFMGKLAVAAKSLTVKNFLDSVLLRTGHKLVIFLPLIDSLYPCHLGIREIRVRTSCAIQSRSIKNCYIALINVPRRDVDQNSWVYWCVDDQQTNGIWFCWCEFV